MSETRTPPPPDEIPKNELPYQVEITPDQVRWLHLRKGGRWFEWKLSRAEAIELALALRGESSAYRV